jgi:peptidoglycan lytic transglycosylase G
VNFSAQPTKKNRIARIVIVLCAIGALLFFIAVGATCFLIRPPAETGEKVVVDIAPGTGLAQIAAQLEDAGLVRSGEAFAILAKKKGVGTALKAGEYEIAVGKSADDILTMLHKGRFRLRRVTIPEGYTVREIAKTFSRAGIDTESNTLELAESSAFARQLGVKSHTLEGYCFPDTYAYHKGVGARALLAKMTTRFKEVFSEEKAAHPNRSGLSDKQAQVLASICEKEAVRSSELPMIARVYLNRLRIGMPLQADPTVIYAIKDFRPPLLRRQLKTPSAYNTYLHKGLPPGPISNPGRLALRGVLDPAEGKAIYFVAQADGSHYFSETYAEHLQAVRRYRRTR